MNARTYTAALTASFIFIAQMGQPVRAADPVEINVVISQTGSAAFLGTKVAQTLAIVEKTVNANGGIGGRRLQFAISDDASSPQNAVQLTSALVAKKVPTLIGSSIVATCAAILPLVQAAGPATYCLATPLQGPDGSYMFTQGTDAKAYVPAALRYLRARNIRRIALITATDASGQAYEKDFDTYASGPDGRDFEVVGREHFSNTDISVSAQIARLKAQSPQVILSFSVGPSFGLLLRSIDESGLNVPVFGSAANLNYAQLESYKAFAPKDLLFFGNAGLVPDPQAKPSVKAAQSTFFHAFEEAGMRPEILNTISWDAAMLFVSALRKLGPNATAVQVRNYVNGLKGWPGLFGEYNFEAVPQRGIGGNSLVLYRWDAAKSLITTVPFS